ncbi:histidine triad protein HinT [Mesomycoplasma molare]|uniref:HIT domain-containing protein n=1 Tax=Mesomycoplasma molare TaxID=171288 RepID=A0ABY5TXU1_9BACT|nr:HIT domain-containing protein [Mesomycoplasma molare]UWD34326.1 HIT domain-containing protein [Mesomycoplasma molare]
MEDLFLKIINRTIPANIIYEDEKVIAFLDIKPVTKGHFLVVPKNYSKNLKTINEDDLQYLFSKARELALEEIKKLNVNGFKLLVNNEKESGQEVFHTHVHIIPSEK